MPSVEETRREYEQILAAQWDGNKGKGPNDIPEEWVIRGVLIVGAVIAVASLISWRWRSGRRGQRVS